MEQNNWQKIIYRPAIIFQSLILFIALILPPILNKYSDAEKGLVVMVSGKWCLYIAIPVIVLFLLTYLPDLIYKKFKKGWFSQHICALRDTVGQYAFSVE